MADIAPPTSRLLMMLQGLLLLLCSIETILSKIWRCDLEASGQIRNNVAQCCISQMIVIEPKLTVNEQVGLCVWSKIWTKHRDRSFSYTLQDQNLSCRRTENL
ncbi:hypothetical protein EDD22DRAFT_916201 [Suillus occidentalis]|nr:hypothetical protein EDD22DRAFT_916201 [Suillus occidentalis]